jgi:hypothetical protein
VCFLLNFVFVHNYIFQLTRVLKKGCSLYIFRKNIPLFKILSFCYVKDDNIFLRKRFSLFNILKVSYPFIRIFMILTSEGLHFIFESALVCLVWSKINSLAVVRTAPAKKDVNEDIKISNDHVRSVSNIGVSKFFVHTSRDKLQSQEKN